MISWIVVLDRRVMGVVDDDTYQCLLRSYVKFSQIPYVVAKDSIRSYETVAEMGRLIYCAFQCGVELDYISVSRLLLVLVAKCLWKESVSVNLSEFILTAVACSAALFIWLRRILRKWIVTSVLSLPTHVLQPLVQWYPTSRSRSTGRPPTTSKSTARAVGKIFFSCSGFLLIFAL